MALTETTNPGTMLGDRYRLDDLLGAAGRARFWRATDTVLARSVSVRVIPSDHPRSADYITAARAAARVTEPRFLQVYDTAADGELTWVVTEWVDGVSLATMIQQGPLSPTRAAWLTREVAEAVAAAHSHGFVHGRLTPESVLLSTSGAIRIAGLMVHSGEPVTEPTLDQRDADLADLAAILYAALTGRWPGVSPAGLPAAPTGPGKGADEVLRPRQVRAGIPRTLDTICDRVLNPHAAHLRIRTAWEISAALSDFIGDPAAAAPTDATSMFADPVNGAAIADQTEPTDLASLTTLMAPAISGPSAAQRVVSAATEPDGAPGPATTVAGVIEFDDAIDAPARGPHRGPAQTVPAPGSARAVDGPTDPVDRDASEAPRISGPLYADHDRRIPAPGPDPGPVGDGFWPFDHPRDADLSEMIDAEPERSASTGRIVALVIAVVFLLVTMAVAFQLGRSGSGASTYPSIGPSASRALTVAGIAP